MKAVILKGKNKGKVVEVLQGCNDWFSVDDEKYIYSPSSLAFNSPDFYTIGQHKNNGILFSLYEPIIAPAWTGVYLFTFKKKKR